MTPTYTITVQKTDENSPISCYICSLRTVGESPLSEGSQIGLGGTITEAMDDWRHRVALWLARHPGFSNWPTPLTDISEIKNLVMSISWTHQSNWNHDARLHTGGEPAVNIVSGISESRVLRVAGRAT